MCGFDLQGTAFDPGTEGGAVSAGRPPLYPGLEADEREGLTELGRVIRDAWVFGLLPEGETCEGWPLDRLLGLAEQVAREWERHGLVPSALPPELRERHARIHGEAFARAKAAGWEPPLDDEDGELPEYEEL